MPIQHWTRNGDVRLEYLEWPAEGEPQGLPLLLVPGSGMSAWGWDEDAGAFTSGQVGGRPRRCIGVSTRGMGNSDSPESGYTPEDLAADVTAVARSARLTDYVIFAYSMGTPIALLHAFRERAQIRGLIIGDYRPRYPRIPAEGAERILSTYARFPDWDALFQHLQARQPELTPERFAATRHMHWRETPQGIVPMWTPRAMRGIQAESRELLLWDRLPELGHLPVLVVRGAEPGALCDEASAAEYQRRLPDCRVVAIPGAGHNISHANPAAFAAALDQFLREVDARAV